MSSPMRTTLGSFVHGLAQPGVEGLAERHRARRARCSAWRRAAVVGSGPVAAVATAITRPRRTRPGTQVGVAFGIEQGVRAGVDVLEQRGRFRVGHIEHARAQRGGRVARRGRDLVLELVVGQPLAVQQRAQADERVLGPPFLFLGVASGSASGRPTWCAAPCGRSPPR